VEAAVLLLGAFVLDALLGDPAWLLVHPIRLVGAAISAGERWLRRRPATRKQEFRRGAVLTCVIVVVSYASVAVLLQTVTDWSWWGGQLVAMVIGSFCLARKDLKEHALAVLAPIQARNLEEAQRMLARMVSRETRGLTEDGLVRGTIESVAENSSDGVIAPLFYLAVGGAPLAFAYKAINTLDSMLGYRTERYEYFGKAAARLDDVVNFLPARFTAVALVGAAWIGNQFDYPVDGATAWRALKRDGRKHASPNAGYPEAALAGALGVQLGGASSYFGKLVKKPTLGDALRPLDASCIPLSLLLLDIASLLALGVSCVGRMFFS
jgi:adenosylcobinamide-phosphate synthase